MVLVCRRVYSVGREPLTSKRREAERDKEEGAGMGKGETEGGMEAGGSASRRSEHSRTWGGEPELSSGESLQSPVWRQVSLARVLSSLLIFVVFKPKLGWGGT